MDARRRGNKRGSHRDHRPARRTARQERAATHRRHGPCRRAGLPRHPEPLLGQRPLEGRSHSEHGDPGRHLRHPRRGHDARTVERQARGAGRDLEDEPARAELQRSFRGEHGFGKWLDAIGRHPNSVNAGSYLGAATVGAYAVGQAAAAPTPAQLDTMRVVVRNAMRDGAFGISSALIYPPGSYARTPELIEMAKAMAPYHGAYITHMRSEGDSLFEAMDEAFRIAREGGVQLDIYHLKASTRRNWGKAPAMVAKIDSARAAGLDVGATMYPYPYSGNNLGECLPDWAAENGKLFDNLRDATTRARILREMADPKGDPLCQVEGPTAYMIAEFRKPENAKYEGRLLSDISADMGKPWPEAIVQLMLSEGHDPSK